MRTVLVVALLVVGVGLMALCCLGVLAMRDAYDRLHFTGPASLAVVAVALAILADEGFSLIANKALLVALFQLVTGPLLVHATARAARIRDHGDWTLEAEANVQVEEG